MLFSALIIAGAGCEPRVKREDAGMTGFAVCPGADGMKGKNVSEERAFGEDTWGKGTSREGTFRVLIFRETMPEGYSQICQTDYTCFVYQDGYYYFQSAADHLYLYRADEQGENRECLAKQIPRELYVVGDWVYFTNLSAGGTLYRIGKEGGEPEEIFPQRIKRFLPLGEILYCLTEEGSLYSWGEGRGAELLYDGDSPWLTTDGTFLYLPIPMREGESSRTIVLDTEGRIAARFDGFLTGMIPDRGNMYYLEPSNNDYYIMRSSIEDGKTEEMAKVPRAISKQIWDCGFVKEGNYLYVVCWDSSSHPRETVLNIYRYDLQKKEWEQSYSKQISDLYLSWAWKASNISIANGSLFYKLPCIGPDGICEDGKGELWYRTGLGDWEEELFEDMEPVQVRDAYSILHSADKERSAYQADDCVYQDEKEADDGKITKLDIVLPQFNDRIPAYEEINRHILDDAERFYRELSESAEYNGDTAQEPWEWFSGDWRYLYAYADDHYVSVLYWDCAAYEQYDMSEVIHKRYVTRLYSAQTGEELEIEDLFTVSEEELMIRFAYTVRKSFSGMYFLRDDFSMLDNCFYRRYYLLTETGIDVILVENLVTKEYHFEISYEELEDIRL